MHKLQRRKILFTVAATITLSQCIIWTAIYISAVTLYSCSTQLSYFTNLLQRGDLKGNTRINYISTLTYVAYLWNGKCKRGNATKAFYWPDRIPSSERTYAWMLSYSLVTSCWIPASVGLMTGAFYGQSEDAVICMSLPWLVITFILTVMDLSAAVMYTFDIFHMTDKKAYLQFIGVGLKNTTIIEGLEGKTPQEWQYDTIIPGVIFVSIYLRLVVLWLINVYLLIKVFNEIWWLRREKKKESVKRPQNFEMSVINRIQEQRPSPQMQDAPNKNAQYVPWMDLVSFKTNVQQQSLTQRRKSELIINTKIAENYNQAKLQRLNEEFRKKYLPVDSQLVKITDNNLSPDRMRRRHSEESYIWREKVRDKARRFSEQQHQIKVIAELLEQRASGTPSKATKQAENERRRSKTKEPVNWYEPIWEMETADSHYTTIENDLYSPVFDYLGQPTPHLQPFKWTLDSPTFKRYEQRIIFNYPVASPTSLQENNPLRRIWNEIQVLKYGPKTQNKPPPSPKIDYEL
ncbi:unnamed protein product [Bemisia tabaci]|uniref:Uncharacterized protein n=1 Tax=Bemisia tabaci TaxID=7038 RepID=A0A9P0A194_BEMTA|nr:unnamed protein product [Bemisia tabaci]